MTFGAMLVALEDHLGITGGETTMLERNINSGKDRVINAAPWPYLETSANQLFTTSVRSYAAPALARSIIGIEDASGTRVINTPRDTFDELHRPSTSTAAAPSRYTENGTDGNGIKQFTVWPDPTGETTGTIRFAVSVPSLTSASDNAATYDHIPVSHHFAILVAAQTEFHKRESDMEKAALSETQFQQIIAQLAGDIQAPVLVAGGES